MPHFENKTAVDFVVVGAGGAGGVVAKELSTAGFQVVVLEQGPYLHEDDFVHDELKYKEPLNVPSIGQETLTNDHALQPNTLRRSEREKATVASAVGYGRCVGGGTVHFTGHYWRFHEIDFVERSRWGPIAGTGFADWPITYAELEPYYTKAEWELGISGLAGASPFDPPRSKPYPLPPVPVKSSAFCWSVVRASWAGILSLLPWRFFPSRITVARNAGTVATASGLDANGAPNPAPWRP